MREITKHTTIATARIQKRQFRITFPLKGMTLNMIDLAQQSCAALQSSLFDSFLEVNNQCIFVAGKQNQSSGIRSDMPNELNPWGQLNLILYFLPEVRYASVSFLILTDDPVKL
ncbi:hypothetical protein Plhal304r1_c051g0135241 [Plasmopara halstedii]